MEWSGIVTGVLLLGVAIYVGAVVDKSLTRMHTAVRRLAVEYKRWSDYDGLLDQRLRELRAEQSVVVSTSDLEWWKLERATHKMEIVRRESTAGFEGRELHREATDDYLTTIDEQIAKLSQKRTE